MPGWQSQGTAASRGYGWAWKKLRAQILERDQGVCYVCGQAGADTVDHRTPKAQGGSDHPYNLGAIHAAPCHARKTAREAAAARAKHARRRPQEQHPGLLR